MASKKLYRIKKEFIQEVEILSNYYIEMAFLNGYVFIKNNKNHVYMINTTVTKKALTVTMLENIEIVE